MSSGGTHDDTTADLVSVRDPAALPQPGLALVLSGGEPQLRCLALGAGPLRVGRGLEADLRVDDATASRLHAEISIVGGAWMVKDGSRHGTFVDGVRVDGVGTFPSARTLRIGASVLAFVTDVTSFVGRRVTVDGDIVVGPTMAAVHAVLERGGREGVDALVLGESGSGKEYAARRFHEGRGGPFVVVNCATISASLFEAELFGHVRGAFSGADRDRPGLFEAAQGGTLFLDEFGEIPLDLQAKLLRVIQERTLRRVGDSRERPIDVRVVGATNRELVPGAVPAWIRPDLYYRLARGVVRLPSLRERWEEMAFLASHALAKVDRVPGATLVERCLLNDWPGNARELLADLAHAVESARAHDEARREARPSPVEGRWLPARMPAPRPILDSSPRSPRRKASRASSSSAPSRCTAATSAPRPSSSASTGTPCTGT
ncbi:MAG: sigma 54-interacting transcriptional regulator [Myxococcales bacterium]|nr:sigma 54-interacting transcriptional regulator [Myxococcales bacterium]